MPRPRRHHQVSLKPTSQGLVIKDTSLQSLVNVNHLSFCQIMQNFAERRKFWGKGQIQQFAAKFQFSQKTASLLHQSTQQQLFNGLLSRTTRIGRYQKDKPFWIFLKQRWWVGSGISWTICKSSVPSSTQVTMPAPHHSFFMGRMLFLPPNQRCQRSEGTKCWRISQWNEKSANWSRYLQPLVNTSCVKLVLARECTEQLSWLKVSETHDTWRLKWYRSRQTAAALEWRRPA